MNKKMKYDQVQTGKCGNDKDEKGSKMKKVKMKILKDLNEGGDGKGEDEEGRELPRDFFDVEDKGKEVNKGSSSSGGDNNNNNNNDNANNDGDNSEDSSSSSVSYKVNDEYEDEANIMIEYSTRIANIISTYKDKQQHKQHKHNQPLHPSSPNTFLSVKRAPPSPSSKAALLSEILN